MCTWDAGCGPEVARRLGHDWWTRSRLAPPDRAPSHFVEGWREAAHAHRPRHAADRHVAKWLQLRWGAWQRGRAVAEDVTPELIREIDVRVCPVTRVALTHGTLTDTDWSVDRLNNDGAYVASNLAVMSTRANRAKGALRFEQVMARARREHETAGLSPTEWLRLAALMLGPCHLHAPLDAPMLPLCAALPARSARLAPQQVQRLLTEHAHRHADKNRLVKALSGAADDASRRRLTLLAERVHAALKNHDRTEERWDVWLHPDVSEAFAAWWRALPMAQCVATARLAARLSGSRQETPATIASWQLGRRGYLPAGEPWRAGINSVQAAEAGAYVPFA